MILTEKPNPDKKGSNIKLKKIFLAAEKNACYWLQAGALIGRR